MVQVVFGSAPGVPNWGSLLQRASDGMEDDEQRHFDTLFVVDSYRAWYGGEPFAPPAPPLPLSYFIHPPHPSRRACSHPPTHIPLPSHLSFLRTRIPIAPGGALSLQERSRRQVGSLMRCPAGRLCHGSWQL